MLDHLKLTQLIVEYHEQSTTRDITVSPPIEQVTLPQVTHYPYHLVAVDGSQIYPDRHEGTLAYLVHTVAVIYDYKLYGSTFSAISKPTVYSGIQADGTVITAQQVDEQRTRAEYQLLAEQAREYALIDGSLGSFNDKNILYAGYVSKPRTRDLVRMLGLNAPLCDAELLKPMLSVGYRTPFAYSRVFNCYYAYMHVAHEIARIEIPEHIAQDTAKVDLLVRMIIDQCTKGDGYPIALAQAHEAAVITQADRRFFYGILQAQDIHVQRSSKLQKKLE